MRNISTPQLEEKFMERVDHGESFLYPKERSYVLRRLQEVRDVDEETYIHSISVGILGSYISRYTLFEPNPRAVFMPAALHDIGKAWIKDKSLLKREFHDVKDKEGIKEHAIIGRNILKVDGYPFCAEVVLRVHRHQPDMYPIEIPEPEIPFGDFTLDVMVPYASGLVSLADSYDRLSYGNYVNSKGQLTQTEIRKKLMTKFTKRSGEDNSKVNLTALIDILYNNDIFGSEAIFKLESHK